MMGELQIAETLLLLGLALLAMASPIANYLISQKRGRDRYVWVALGIVAPIASTIVLIFLGRPVTAKG